MDHGPTSIDPGVPEKGWDEFNVVRASENLGWPGVRGCGTGSGITEPVVAWQASMPPGGAALYTVRRSSTASFRISFPWRLPFSPRESSAVPGTSAGGENVRPSSRDRVAMKFVP
jgi:hypothetical protein